MFVKAPNTMRVSSKTFSVCCSVCCSVLQCVAVCFIVLCCRELTLEKQNCQGSKYNARVLEDLFRVLQCVLQYVAVVL